MAVPKFALLFFPDANVVTIESSDVIRGEHRKLEYAVNSMEDFEREEGFVEVCLPSRSRNGPAQVLAAKILLFGDAYRDLVHKKNAFKKGENIWRTTVTRSPKKAANKLGQASQKAAAHKMNENLKRDVQASKQPVTPTTQLEDSDETDLDNTDIDLFETTQQRSARKRRALLESDDESLRNENESTSAVSQSGEPILYTVQLDGETVQALKELPTVLLSLKATLEALDRNTSHSNSPTSSSSEQSIPSQLEMVSLGGSDVQIPKRVYDRLNKSRVSLYTQDLASVVFGKETLAKSTLTGKNGKDQLDANKVSVLIDTVMERFPNSSVSEVRSIIRRKCNNESYSKKPHSTE